MADNCTKVMFSKFILYFENDSILLEPLYSSSVEETFRNLASEFELNCTFQFPSEENQKDEYIFKFPLYPGCVLTFYRSGAMICTFRKKLPLHLALDTLTSFLITISKRWTPR